MEHKPTGKYRNKILTVPNALSMFRLLLVPLFCWTYLRLGNMWCTLGILALSGATDMADGWIARRFDMISDVGKVLDPVADKVTQGAMLLCLLVSYPVLTPVFVLLVIKEVTDVLTGYLVMKKTGVVLAAEWHGKAATVLLYATMLLHVLWRSFPSWGAIPSWLSVALMLVCSVMVALSMVLYTIRNVGLLRKHKEAKKNGS